MAGFRKELTDLVRPQLKSPPGMTQQLVEAIDEICDRAGVPRDDGSPPKFAATPGAGGFRKQLADLLRPNLTSPPGMTQSLVDGLDGIWDRCGVAKDDPSAAAKPGGAPAAAGGTKLANRTAFYAALQTSFGALKASQTGGIDEILTACGAASWGAAYVANALGTAWLETNRTMLPVEEAYYLGARAAAWRKANLRYYPWYGRGYVQLTWDYNYKKADRELGLGGTLIADPARALEPDIAARVMVRGMQEGWFTGKKLGDYLPKTGPGTALQHKEARRIINGTDRWDDLSSFAMKFQAALQAGGWS